MKKVLILMATMCLISVVDAAVNNRGVGHDGCSYEKVVGLHAAQIIAGKMCHETSFKYSSLEAEKKLQVEANFEKLPIVKGLYHHRVCNTTHDMVDGPILTGAESSFLMNNIKMEINRVFLSVPEIKDILMNNREGYNRSVLYCMQQMDKFICLCKNSSEMLNNLILFKEAVVKIYDYMAKFKQFLSHLSIRYREHGIFAVNFDTIDGELTPVDRLQIMAIFNGIERNCERIVTVIKDNI